MSKINQNNPTAPSIVFQAVANDVSLLAKAAAATATVVGTAQDFGTVLNSDAIVTSFIHGITGTPTSVTVTVEESADNSTWNTLATFTVLTVAQTAPEMQKIAQTKRYMRALITIVGGSSPTVTGSVLILK